MALNKQKGQMYPWVTHTWNPIRGNCPHQCSYCYMKIRGDLGAMRLDEKAILDSLGHKWKDTNGFWLKEKTIFVGSSTDMWARGIFSEDIQKVLYRCSMASQNTYLFQSKNPCRFRDFIYRFPDRKIWGTTIEATIDYNFSQAPTPFDRAETMAIYRATLPDSLKLMVSIEPIMDFNLKVFIKWMEEIEPNFVSIGADSQGHKLPEPPPDKIKKLIEELQKFTEVKIKSNLKRLLQ